MKHNLALVVNGEIDSRVVLRKVVNACDEVKGREISILDVRGISDVSDYLVVVSGKSDRQVQGICNRVLGTLAESGLSPVSVEGYEDAQWVLIDCGDVVVHVFYEPVREYYSLESLWMQAKIIELDEKGVRRSPRNSKPTALSAAT